MTTVVPSAARTTTGNSGRLGLPKILEGGHLANVEDLCLLVNVSAASGVSPTLNLDVQWSPDGTTWMTADPADDFAEITAATQTVKRFAIKGPHYRIVWTIGGTTPSFTFQIDDFATI